MLDQMDGNGPAEQRRGCNGQYGLTITLTGDTNERPFLVLADIALGRAPVRLFQSTLRVFRPVMFDHCSGSEPAQIHKTLNMRFRHTSQMIGRNARMSPCQQSFSSS